MCYSRSTPLSSFPPSSSRCPLRRSLVIFPFFFCSLFFLTPPLPFTLCFSSVCNFASLSLSVCMCMYVCVCVCQRLFPYTSLGFLLPSRTLPFFFVQSSSCPPLLALLCATVHRAFSLLTPSFGPSCLFKSLSLCYCCTR